MTSKQFTKFAVDDLVYRYSSPQQKEGDAGIAVRVILGQEGVEPHVVYQRPDGSSSTIVDCKDYGYGGPPPKVARQASAIVKWLSNAGAPVPSVDSHQEWPVEQETNGWALARDPWDGRLHWLTSGSEYSLRVGGNERWHVVTMQTLLL